MATTPDAPVSLRTGIDGDEQMSAFMNATLQTVGSDEMAVSIATYVQVPAEVVAQGEQAVAGWLREQLGAAAEAAEGLTFEAELGPFAAQ